MTISWLEAHASYISIYRLKTTEQLTFIKGPSHDNPALLKVPVIPANVLQSSARLTVKIAVGHDVDIGTKEDSDIRYGVSDGTSFVGFAVDNKDNYETYSPCFGIEGSPGTTLTGERRINEYSAMSTVTFYPGQYIITLKLDESWGSCYTAGAP